MTIEDAGARDESPHRIKGRGINWLSAAPVLIAVLSLAVATYGLVAARVSPEIIVAMPDRVRIAAVPDSAWLYLQPRFFNTGKNDRVDVVTGIDVTLVTPTGERLALVWDEQGSWVYDPATRSLTWVFQADPAPLAITRLAPQMPTGLFIAPRGWNWEAGTYRVELSATREASDEPLAGVITLAIAPEELAFVLGNPGSFVEIAASPGADG